MKIVFRADASIEIGTGHVSRCLTLAHRMREIGATCMFVCRAHSGNLIATIRQRGFAVAELPVEEQWSCMSDGTTPHAEWLGASWQTDAQQSIEALVGTNPDWIIVDHYALGAAWHRSLRALCTRIMVIDDLADRVHDCDLLLDQNLGRRRADYAGLVPQSCEILVGPRYALLREEFSVLRTVSLARRARPALRHILISMGGIDKDNATGRVLNALHASVLAENLRITVVMGAAAPWLGDVRECAARMPCATTVRVDVTDMAGLMADCDLAIGAAGMTAWERCCMGLPALIIVLAENQRQGAAALEAIGAALIIDGDTGLPSELLSKLALCSNPETLESMQTAACAVTDGTGFDDIFAVMNDHERP